MNLFSLPVYQAIARFDSGKNVELTFFFYNRGDAPGVDKDAFFGIRDKAVEAISSFTKAKPVLVGKDAHNAVKADGVAWETASSHFLLEWSFTREIKTRNIPFRPEFVRLLVTPAAKQQGMLQSHLGAASASARFNGPSHVKRAENGDVVIEGIPMVDQGDKGYCVVASAERVMRYYGLKVDEHELAQIANTSVSGGTSTQAMLEALKKISSRLRIKTRPIEAMNIHAIMELVNDYNRAARRGRQAPEIKLVGHVIDVPSLYRQMKPDVLKAARSHNPADVSRFLRQIQPHIDQGIPVLWSVMLGIIPGQREPQSFGGHMRLLIGYNPKTSEVIYSDSWGLGHELKRMPLDDAHTITTGLYLVEPM
jgi:hypothetical protein